MHFPHWITQTYGSVMKIKQMDIAQRAEDVSCRPMRRRITDERSLYGWVEHISLQEIINWQIKWPEHESCRMCVDTYCWSRHSLNPHHVVSIKRPKLHSTGAFAVQMSFRLFSVKERSVDSPILTSVKCFGNARLNCARSDAVKASAAWCFIITFHSQCRLQKDFKVLGRPSQRLRQTKNCPKTSSTSKVL